MPPARRLANLSAAGPLLGNGLVSQPVRYRLIGRRLEAMLASEESGFAFEVEMIVECARRGWAIDWVPIRTIYGDEKSHINPVTHLARFLTLAVRIRRARGRAADAQGRARDRPGAPRGRGDGGDREAGAP
jgi:hypothetical protein